MLRLAKQWKSSLILVFLKLFRIFYTSKKGNYEVKSLKISKDVYTEILSKLLSLPAAGSLRRTADCQSTGTLARRWNVVPDAQTQIIRYQ
jgi:hypothetical protein